MKHWIRNGSENKKDTFMSTTKTKWKTTATTTTAKQQQQYQKPLSNIRGNKNVIYSRKSWERKQPLVQYVKIMKTEIVLPNFNSKPCFQVINWTSGVRFTKLLKQNS